MVGLGRVRAVQRDDVARGEQLVHVHVRCAEFLGRRCIERGALGVGDRHAEGLRAARSGDADLTHADDAELATLDSRAEHVEHAPLPRRLAANDALALGEAASDHQDERHCDVRGRIRQHARSVGDDHVALRAGRDVDVVVPDGNVGDALQLRAGCVQQLAIDLLGEQGDECVSTLHARQQLGARDRVRLFPGEDVVGLAQRLEGDLGDLAGDDDAGHQEAIHLPKSSRPSLMSWLLMPENAKRMY